MSGYVRSAGGRVVAIATAPAAAAPMAVLERADLVAGTGVAGDRYAAGAGTFSRPDRRWGEVTLVAAETLAAVGRETGRPLSVLDTRRNLVTVDVDLEALVGHDLVVGGAVLRGLRRCGPCAHLEGLLGRPARELLAGRGGLGAAVVRGGPVAVGDPVDPAPASTTDHPLPEDSP